MTYFVYAEWYFYFVSFDSLLGVSIPLLWSPRQSDSHPTFGMDFLYFYRDNLPNTNMHR